MNIITLIVGDWSDDGHGKTDHIDVSVNVSKAALKNACETGQHLCGIKLRDICRNYEDNRFSQEDLLKLEQKQPNIRQLLIDNDAWIAGEEDDELLDCRLSTMSFAVLYMELARVGDPSIEYEFVVGDSINIGGYGLFC